MRSTFYGMEVARTGLFTSQNQLNTTGHNISNVDTEGYTRQRLDTSAIPAAMLRVMFAEDNRAATGRGVETLTVNQIRDGFVDAKYRTERTETDYWETKMTEFEMIEQLYNSVIESSETSANIFNAISEFQTALLELEDNPSSIAIRQTVVTAAQQMAETFNYIYGKLETHHDDVNNTVEVIVGQINDVSESIAELNRQIAAFELTGAKANDLRDTRNLMLDELAGLIKMDYYEDENGHVNVTVGNKLLVDGVETNRIACDPAGAENQLDVVSNETAIGVNNRVMWANAMGTPSTEPLYIGGGKLKAYLDIRDGSTEINPGIPYAAMKLNELAQEIAKEVNDIHREGYTMPFLESFAPGSADRVRQYDAEGGNTYGELESGTVLNKVGEELKYYKSTTGINFFEAGVGGDYSLINARNFSVAYEIVENPYLIACSSELMLAENELNEDNGFNMKTGNNDNLKLMIQLADRKDALGHSDNYQDRLKLLVAEVGTLQGHMDDMNASQQTRQYALEQQRFSISGVSIDEEMTNIIRFNHAYNANARVITTIDQELDTLINSTGIVGR